MKIIYISFAELPSRAAHSIHIMKMCSAFAENGHDVTLFAPQKNKINDKEGLYKYYDVRHRFPITFLPWKNIKGRSVLYAFHAALKAKKMKPNIVYCRGLYGGFFSTIIGNHTIFEIHDDEDKHSILGNFICGMIFEKALQVVTISEALYSYFRERYPENAKKIIVAPDGADPVRKNIEKISLEGNSEKIKIGYIGHMYKGRGVELIEKIAEKTKDIADYYVVGGKEEDIVYWRKKTEKLNNFYVKGFVPPSETVKFRNSFDILLAPYMKNVFTASRRDTSKWMSPLKLFEYMSSGKPVICSDISVLKEILKNGETAYLCSPDNVSEWVDVVEYYKTNKEDMKKVGMVAKKLFEEKYTWSARVRRILDEIS